MGFQVQLLEHKQLTAAAKYQVVKPLAEANIVEPDNCFLMYITSYGILGNNQNA